MNAHTGSSRRNFVKASLAAIAAPAFSPLARAAESSETGLLPRSIHPYPNKVKWGDGTSSLSKRVNLKVASGCDASLVELMTDTWNRFTFGSAELVVVRDAKLKEGEFALEGAIPPPRDPNATYALAANTSGIGGSASDTASARHAWFTMLQLLDSDDAADGGLTFTFPHVEIQDWPELKFRGLHLCVFHETPPVMIEKAIRLAAFLKFTHVVIEFWGMLALESLKELSWPEAWSKAEASKLVEIARRMGMEVIPMFNSWGHASASRIKHGRHVVLDQNPRLAPLFEPDGWTWCLTNPRTQDLIRRVCDELVEFAGPSQYFHIGCDEAYSHATCDRCRQTDRVQLFTDHVNQLAAHLAGRGRRAMMWGDALLERSKWPAGFSANGTPGLPTHLAIDRVSRRIVIADWHYDVKGDVPTLAHFRDRGFDTIACPWESPDNIRALAKAARANGSAGVLLTTWHHLVQVMPLIPYAGACVWSQGQKSLGMRQAEWSLSRAATATMLRKLVPADGQFERAGWNTFELPAAAD